jgi:hypothetical protein
MAPPVQHSRTNAIPGYTWFTKDSHVLDQEELYTNEPLEQWGVAGLLITLR